MLLDGGKGVSILQGQSAKPCDKVLPSVLHRYVESRCRAGRDRKYFLDRCLLEQDAFHQCCQATQSLMSYRKGESFLRFAIDTPHCGRQQDSFGSIWGGRGHGAWLGPERPDPRNAPRGTKGSQRPQITSTQKGLPQPSLDF